MLRVWGSGLRVWDFGYSWGSSLHLALTRYLRLHLEVRVGVKFRGYCFKIPSNI